MIQITAKNIKVAQFASEETLCFECTIYVDGKRAFVASNEGRGGPNAYHPVKGQDLAAFDDNLQRVTDHARSLATVEPQGQHSGTIDEEIDRVLHDNLLAKELKRALKGKLLYTKADEDGVWEVKKHSDLAGHIAHLVAKGYRVLNTMPFDEAIALYR